MTPDDFLLAAFIFVAASLYSSVGHAGASGYLAAMALFGLASNVMRPTALVLNILVASLATFRYARAGQTDWKLLAPFALGSVPAAFIGGLAPIPPALYRPLLGVVLLASAAQFLRSMFKAESADLRASPPRFIAAIATGGVIGMMSGLTGTGGGIFLSPVLLFMHWATTRSASGVAAGFILVNSIAGLAGTRFTTDQLADALPLWAIAALSGGLIGTWLGTRALPVPGLRAALALVLVIAGLKLLLV